MRTLLIFLVCALLCASCGVAGRDTEADIAAYGDIRDTSGFALTVLPESFAPGGSASDVTATPRVEGDNVVVEVRGRADRLRAFYFELAYDSSRFRPLDVEQRLGADSEVLQLAVTDRPGRVHAGRILTRPQTREGISGELLLARIRFMRGSLEQGRSVSRPPYRSSSTAQLTISAAGLLEWKFESTGDYDQNKVVTIADMTPIAVQLDETTGGGPFLYDTIESVVDGDGNGTITIGEITPIAPNLGNELINYRVYRSQDVNDYPADPLAVPALAEIGSVPYEDGVGVINQVRLSYSFDAAALGGLDPANLFWVRPVDGAGTAGTPSNFISPNGVGNQDPQISSFTGIPNPILGGNDVALTVVAADPDAGDTLTYEYTENGGDTDDTGTDTTIFHAPVVLTQTAFTVTVTVQDQLGGTAQEDLLIVVDPEPVTEVHIAFSPAAEGGVGTTANAHALLGDADYTFTATDQDGNDITSNTTFSYVNDAGGPFPQGSFVGNTLTTNIVGNGTFSVIGTYMDGGPDEMASNPDLIGEPMHFTIVFTLP